MFSDGEQLIWECIMKCHGRVFVIDVLYNRKRGCVMKIIVNILAMIMAAWSVYDFFKVFLIKKRYKKLNPKIVFSATKLHYAYVAVGLFLCGICLTAAYVNTEYTLVLLGIACLSGAVREFSHSYYVETEQFIIMNGREIPYGEIRENGKVRKMCLISFVSIFEVCTNQYREYVYVSKEYERKWSAL